MLIDGMGMWPTPGRECWRSKMSRRPLNDAGNTSIVVVDCGTFATVD
jgi:hypothetical protein